MSRSNRFGFGVLACGLLWGCAESGENGNGKGGRGGLGWTTATTGGAGGTVDPSGGAGGAGNAVAPAVAAIDPTDATTAVAPDTDVVVTFSLPMDAATLTTLNSATCSGALQLSLDGFATCIPASANVMDDTTVSLSPTTPLPSAGLVRLRATTDVQSAVGTALAEPFESLGFMVRYGHTVVIDGVNDFDAADEIGSSTGGAKIYVTFDDTHLYLGLEHPDIVVGGGGDKFVYFLMSTDPTRADGNPTSSDGKAQFGAAAEGRMMFHYKEQIDGGDYSEFRRAQAGTWDTDWTEANKAVFKSAGYLEASIQLSELGDGLTNLLVTTFTVDYAGQNGDGHLYNMLPGAQEGSGVPALNVATYVHLQLPTSKPPSDGTLLQSF